jgi:hypothetical protein
LVLNLTQAVERAVKCRQLSNRLPERTGTAAIAENKDKGSEKSNQTEQMRVRSSIVMRQLEVAQQRQQQKLELFRKIKQMRATGMKVSQIAR